MDLDIRKEYLNVRCPNCFKLFSVETAAVTEAKPRFQCTDCAQKFWIPFADSLKEEMVVGFPVIEPARPNAEPEKMTELITKPFRCPKCSAHYAAGQDECEKCGIIFAKFIGDGDNTFVHSTTPEIRELWSDVLDDYENYSLHQKFISQCLAENDLDLAMNRYADILSYNAQDEMAKKAMAEIKALALARWESHTEKVPKSSPFNFRVPKIRIGNIGMVIAAFLIFFGIMVPSLRNLVGFGTAMLFSLLALRYYFRLL